MPGLNDDEAPDLLAWALDEGYELRIIEQMPLDAGHSWQRDRMITAEQILADAAHAVHPHRRRRPSAAARPRSGSSSTGHRPRRRPGHGRGHRVGHPAVLRQLRPHPPHRRRPGPHLPVRAHRERPALAPARRRHRRRDRRRLARGHVGQEARPRHRRPRVPAARPTHERDRRMMTRTHRPTPPRRPHRRRHRPLLRRRQGRGRRASEPVSVPAGTTVDDLVAALAADHGDALGPRARGRRASCSTRSPCATAARSSPDGRRPRRPAALRRRLSATPTRHAPPPRCPSET